jgi:ABC-type transporter Mla maintaining outer membrane lipid asymmetry permease subunit MlaE
MIYLMTYVPLHVPVLRYALYMVPPSILSSRFTGSVVHLLVYEQVLDLKTQIFSGQYVAHNRTKAPAHQERD